MAVPPMLPGAQNSPWRPQPPNRYVPGRPRLNRGVQQFFSLLSACWRRLMFSTRVIAITGSHGKSTAKKCLGTILSAHGRTNWFDDAENDRKSLSDCLLRTGPSHRYTVLEVGATRPGRMAIHSRLIDPDIVPVLSVGLQHTNRFPDLASMAREKSLLLRGIRGKRIAVLNGDDPYVKAMAAGCRGRVVLFGRSPEFDVWADGVSARWPDRLQFTAHAGDESVRMQTRLVGEHWLPSVLGALATAKACGLNLSGCVEPLSRAEPVTGRLSVHPLPCGATVLRDDFNASRSSLLPALDILRQARAGRRLVVLGDYFDSPDSNRARYEEVGRLAAASADMALVIGSKMNVAVRTAIAAGMDPASVRAFRHMEDAAAHLRQVLRAGDLVLLRARGEFRMERIYFAQLGTIRCWMSRCGSRQQCDTCMHLGFQPSPAGE